MTSLSRSPEAPAALDALSPSDDPAFAPQTLTSGADIAEFREALAHFQDGQWSEDRFKTFRLRFGVYAQRQQGQYMVRAKVPGGRLTLSQARAAAAANRDYAGGPFRITTRQDFQFYYMSLDDAADLMEHLSEGGVSTRESSGNTFRNIVACPLSGVCPSERVNAQDIAERLSLAWLRHPLTQHMPRKFKTTVSGCGADCGGGRMDDLGLVAVEQDGQPGFKVTAGGGLGTQPRMGVTLSEFTPEEDLPIVMEALARLHNAQSSRKNKNKARIKFLVDKLGADGFVAAYKDIFDQIKDLPRRAYETAEWREPTGEAPAWEGTSQFTQADGRTAVLARTPTGSISSEQLDALANAAEAVGAETLTLTRDQNVLIPNVPVEQVSSTIARIEAAGLSSPQKTQGLDDLINCPGASTCPLAVTNADGLAEAFKAQSDRFEDLPSSRLRISGCHNSCGQHHVGELGFHGLAKKIKGRSAPHYQLHLGGRLAGDTAVGLTGPVLPATKVIDAAHTLLSRYNEDRQGEEGFGDWSRRIGVEAIEALVEPYKATEEDATTEATFIDWGFDEAFEKPKATVAECAAGAVVAEHLADRAETARLDLGRALATGQVDQARAHGKDAILASALRLLAVQDPLAEKTPEESILDEMRSLWGHREGLTQALNAALNAQEKAQGADADEAAFGQFDQALRLWALAANDAVEGMLSDVTRAAS